MMYGLWFAKDLELHIDQLVGRAALGCIADCRPITVVCLHILALFRYQPPNPPSGVLSPILALEGIRSSKSIDESLSIQYFRMEKHDYQSISGPFLEIGSVSQHLCICFRHSAEEATMAVRVLIINHQAGADVSIYSV
jgi:hypothetical protein